jgi:hypothetical protein
MSESEILYCAETKQAVHVAERFSSGFRGPDYAVVVGAFCLVHSDKELQSALGFDELDNALEYEVWTPENVQAASSLLTDQPIAKLAERLTFPYL